MRVSTEGASGRALAAGFTITAAAGLVLAVATGVSPDGVWGEAATGFGIVALAMIAMQFFSSGRFRALTARIGMDRMIGFHTWTARLVVAAVILHPLLYLAPTFIADPSLGLERAARMFFGERARTGLVAWLAIIAIPLLVLARKWFGARYELWRATHAIFAAVALVFGVAHAVSVGTYAAAISLSAFWIGLAGAALATLAAVHVWRGLAMRRDLWSLAWKKQVGRGLWELAFRRDGAEPFDYRAGQFVWLTTAPRLQPLFDHPFSIASTPRESELRLVIKEVGDYTRGVGNFPEGLKAGIDGPHGVFTADPEAEAFLLLAGGAGVAPILGILRDFDRAGETRPIRVVLCAGGPDRIVARDEIEAMASRLDLEARFIVEEAGPDWTGETGRLDATSLAPSLSGLPAAGAQALICGPTAFMTSLADILLDRGFDPDRIDYERFDYSGGPLSRIDVAERWRYRALALTLGVAILAFSFRG